MKSLKEFINEGLKDHLKKIKTKIQKFINTNAQIPGNIISTAYYAEYGEDIDTDENEAMVKSWITKVNDVISTTTKLKTPEAETCGPWGISYVFETDETDETVLRGYWENISKELIKYFKNENVKIYDEFENKNPKPNAIGIGVESKIYPSLGVVFEIWF